MRIERDVLFRWCQQQTEQAWTWARQRARKHKQTNQHDHTTCQPYIATLAPPAQPQHAWWMRWIKLTLRRSHGRTRLVLLLLVLVRRTCANENAVGGI
jgi:hypothetical protein